MRPRQYRRSAAEGKIWHDGSPELARRILEAAGISTRREGVDPVALNSLRAAVLVAEDLARPIDDRPVRRMPAWLLASFDKYNALHFGGRLPKPLLLVNRAKGRFYGMHLPPTDGRPALLFVTTAALAKGRAFAREVLLHEMVHHSVATLLGAPDEEPHGPAFVAEANRVGAVYGWPRVVKPDGMAARMWPHARRPRAKSARGGAVRTGAQSSRRGAVGARIVGGGVSTKETWT